LTADVDAACARFHPDDDKQNVIMAGCGDKKVYQWDSDTGDLVQVRPGCIGRSILSNACNDLQFLLGNITSYLPLKWQHFSSAVQCAVQ